MASSKSVSGSRTANTNGPSSLKATTAPPLSERKEPASLMVCQSWWKNCLVQGDQYKKYRQLYSKTTKLTTLRSKEKTTAEESNGSKRSENEGADAELPSVSIDSLLPSTYKIERHGISRVDGLPGDCLVGQSLGAPQYPRGEAPKERQDNFGPPEANLGRRNERLQRQRIGVARPPDLLRGATSSGCKG